MKLSKLLSTLTSIIPQNTLHPNTDITSIEIDSRQVGPGTLFVALVGAQADGHQYVEQAVASGAAAILVHQDRASDFERLGVPVLCALNTRAILGALSACFYDDPSAHMQVIGITGTNGKTTTAFILEQLCLLMGRTPGIIGTVNYRWKQKTLPAPNTTPESLTLQRLMAQMRADGVDTVIMEVSSHGLATHRVDAVRFDVGIYTNLTQDHLDFHGTLENYAAAKARLFQEVLPQGGKTTTAILNLDDPHVLALYRELEQQGSTSTLIGTSLMGQLEANAAVLSAHVNLEGARFGYHTPKGRYSLFSPMLGRFNVSNLLQALCAIEALKLDLGALNEDALAAWGGVPGRLERVVSSCSPSAPSIFVDYAHTPDALARALETLARHCAGDLWVVFGCGGDRDRGKRPQMGKIAASFAQAVVLTSDNPRTEPPLDIIDHIAAGIDSAPPIFIREPDRARAIELVTSWAKPQDVILIAGKGHETYQEQDGQRRPFDDRQVARLALAKRQSLAISTWSLAQIARAIGATLHEAPDPSLKPQSLTTDTRKCEPGSLFVALRGERFDAHDFLQDAVGQGASALLVSKHQPTLNTPQLVVEDTLAALQRLGAAIWAKQRDEHGLFSVAITGSNGKTTTKELLRALWHHIGPTAATSGNLNNEIGVPLTLCALPEHAKISIIEMGAGKPGDIAELIALAPADVRLITSIGAAHLERLGGLDGVRAVKAGIFDLSTTSTVAVIPHHERDNLIPAGFPGRVLTFGPEPDADVRVLSSEPLELDATQGQRVTLQHHSTRYIFELPLVGEHNASNLAAAWATMLGAGRAPAQTARLLKPLHVPGGRWRRVERGAKVFIDDAYNANPSSMTASFEAFMRWQSSLQDLHGPRVAVIGPMLELGEDAKNWHLRVIQSISKPVELNVLITVGAFAADMAAKAREVGHPDLLIYDAKDVEQAAAILDTIPQGLVFLKASRGARLERVLDLVQDGQG